MSRSRRLLIPALAAVVVVAAGLTWWVIAARSASPWVPTCTDLISGLRADPGGTWRVSDPDDGRDNGHDNVSTCEFAFVSADRKHTGTLALFTAGAPDPETARRDVAGYPCVDEVMDPRPPGYLAFRLCTQTTELRTTASTYAAKDDRQATAMAAVNLRDDTASATTFAQDLSRLVADRALTVPESG